MAAPLPKDLETGLRWLTNETLNAIRSDLRDGLLSVREQLIRPPGEVVAPPPPKVEESLVIQAGQPIRSGSTSATNSDGNSGSGGSSDLPSFSAHITVLGQLRVATIYGTYT